MILKTFVFIDYESFFMTKNGRDKTWEFFKQNKEEIRNRYEAGFMLSKLVKRLMV
jgi:hypothetical protein